MRKEQIPETHTTQLRHLESTVTIHKEVEHMNIDSAEIGFAKILIVD